MSVKESKRMGVSYDTKKKTNVPAQVYTKKYLNNAWGKFMRSGANKRMKFEAYLKSLNKK